jgi:two-component system sensor histidine kinase BaeS
MADHVAGDRPDAQRRFRRRLLLVAIAFTASWTAVVVVLGETSGLWAGDGPRGGRLLVGLATVATDAAVAVGYRRLSRPVGDLLGAAERVAGGDYRVDVDIRGPRELRLLTVTFNEMAARLAANEEQRRRFLADITHELRNPLAVLQSEIEAQLDGIHPRDDHHLASLLEETRRLGQMAGDLHTLVCDVLRRHEARGRQRAVALCASIPPELPKAWVDPARVRQVLDNLVANAIRHTPAGGTVMVEVSTVDSGSDDRPMLRCRVTDAGPGFREDQLGQVFERFTRAGDSSGSGLGLSIARDLVIAQGERCTPVTIRLPAVRVSVSPRPPERQPRTIELP